MYGYRVIRENMIKSSHNQLIFYFRYSKFFLIGKQNPHDTICKTTLKNLKPT
jgi:hypothetical protein